MLACWVTRSQVERLRKHLTTSINPPCPSHFLCLLLKRLDDLFSGKWLEVTGPGREIKARTATTQTKIPKRKRRKDGRNKKADPFLGFFFFISLWEIIGLTGNITKAQERKALLPSAAMYRSVHCHTTRPQFISDISSSVISEISLLV